MSIKLESTYSQNKPIFAYYSSISKAVTINLEIKQHTLNLYSPGDSRLETKRLASDAQHHFNKSNIHTVL